MLPNFPAMDLAFLCNLLEFLGSPIKVLFRPFARLMKYQSYNILLYSDD